MIVNEQLRKRPFQKRPVQQRRGIEPPGFIHLPKIGQVAHEQIEYMLSEGMTCWVKLKGVSKPALLSEPLAYFARRLPTFERITLPGNKARLQPKSTTTA